MSRNEAGTPTCSEIPSKSRHLAVKNFEAYQHYKDRPPLWIKLYNTLLDDPAFIALGDAARSHLMLIWLIASRHNNRIPYDSKYIARATHARSRIDLQALIDAGWLIVVVDGVAAPAGAGDSASRTLADETNSASGPASTEKRRDREEEPLLPPHARTTAPTDPGLVEMLGPDRGEAFDRHVASWCGRGAIGLYVGEMRAALSGGGIHGITCTVEQLASAVDDFLANTAGEKPNAARFRRYLQTASRPARAGPGAGNSSLRPPRRNAGAATFQNARDAVRDLP